MSVGAWNVRSQETETEKENLAMYKNRVLHIQTNNYDTAKQLRVIDDFETPGQAVLAQAVITNNKALVDLVTQSMMDTFLCERTIENGVFMERDGKRYAYARTR